MPDSVVGDLQLRFKAVGRKDAGNPWEYFRPREEELKTLLNAAGGAKVRIRHIEFREGSLEILAIIAIVKGAIGLGGLILGLMQAFSNYDKTKAGFHDAAADCKAFVDKVCYRVHEFFSGFGDSHRSSEA